MLLLILLLLLVLLGFDLVAEFISPQKVYTFSSIVIGGYSIPKCVKCTHSDTKLKVAR